MSSTCNRLDLESLGGAKSMWVLFVFIYLFIYFNLVLHRMLIKSTSSKLCYINKCMRKHQTKTMVKIGSPMV